MESQQSIKWFQPAAENFIIFTQTRPKWLRNLILIPTNAYVGFSFFSYYFKLKCANGKNQKILGKRLGNTKLGSPLILNLTQNKTCWLPQIRTQFSLERTLKRGSSGESETCHIQKRFTLLRLIIPNKTLYLEQATKNTIKGLTFPTWKE